MHKFNQSLLALVITTLAANLSPAQAALTLTVDRNTGAWAFDATSDIDVRFSNLFSTHDAFWLDFSATSGSVAPNSAAFSYSGTYNNAPVNGVGTATFSTLNPGGAPRDFRLNFGNTTITSPGTFTSFALTPSANFNNPSSYNPAVNGSIPQVAPNTNEPITVVVVPEPTSALLIGIGVAAVFLRRRRK